MKNRCQVFEKSIGLYIIVLITLFYSCAEDKGNYDYKAVNEVIVTGVTEDTSVMRGEVLNIHPVIGRSLQASEEGLEYSWSLAGKEIGTNRDLAYSVPETLNVGKYDCRYVVTDTKNGMKYFVDFNVNVVSNFSWGYYFLCEEPDQSAVLSYFSSKEGTTECLHATKIGDYALGKQPKAIIDHFGNISSLNDYFYSFNIITSQGDNPVIMTNNGAFMPSGSINDQSFIYEGDTFNPTDAVYMLTDAVYYVSNGKIYSYNSGLLYRAAKHDKEYYWSNPASAYTYVYVFDELSKKFYILKNQIDDPALGLVSDPYALDRVVEIKNQPSYEGQTIIHKYVSRAHVMSMATAQTGKINLISFEYIDFKKAMEEEPAVNEDGHLLEMETLPLAGADADTKGVLVAENDWYFVVGNKVYTTPVLKPTLADFVTLPDDIGKPVAVAVSAKETQLIIATYDAGSPKEYKGSFAIVDLMSKEVTLHRNVMGKCVVAKGYDSNPWW